MADLKGNKKRLAINLSLFAAPDHNGWAKSTAKSPRSFQPNADGVVGLGIVAAMNHADQTKSGRAAILAVSPRSTTTPIPIAAGGAKFGGGPNLEAELSEGYTCVISHVGENLIRKREYFDGVFANESQVSSGPVAGVQGHGSEEAAMVFPTAEFLSSCNLCKKRLHGLDIFMYRGEKAFCSAECRCKQISMDERKERCVSGGMKQLECSVSPCSSPMQFFAGLAAA